MSYLTVFGGGVISFLSPCVLPLVPGYLSVICRISYDELTDGNAGVRFRILRDTALFVTGFSIVFIALGLSATAFSALLFRNQLWLTRISGAMLLAMAFMLVGVHFLRVRWLMGEARFRPPIAKLGPFTAPVTGAAFAFGWTPCIGPVLASVLTVAAGSGDSLRGGSLLAVYSLGLGVPFVVTGIAFQQASQVFAWVKRHYAVLNLGTAVVLALYGILLLLDRLSWVTIQLQNLMRTLRLDWLINLG